MECNICSTFNKIISSPIAKEFCLLFFFVTLLCEAIRNFKVYRAFFSLTSAMTCSLLQTCQDSFIESFVQTVNGANKLDSFDNIINASGHAIVSTTLFLYNLTQPGGVNSFWKRPGIDSKHRCSFQP